MDYVGILLAAGSSRRFGADKLLHPLTDNTPLAIISARILSTHLSTVVAVIRPQQETLKHLLEQENIQIITAENAILGMGHSLAAGVCATQAADGWIVALADMPYIQPITVQHIIQALDAGHRLVAPRFNGQKGHPVGFHRDFLPMLQNLTGDQGARDLFKTASVTWLPTQDAGVVRDVDYPHDLD